MDLTPDQIAEVRAGTAVKQVRPELEGLIGGMEKTTKTKVYQHIREGTLTPELALQGWMEMYSYSRLDSRIKELAAKGE